MAWLRRQFLRLFVSTAKPRLKEARFCPFCGTETLLRDEYRKTEGALAKGGKSVWHGSPPEFVCSVCNRGMAITPSLRVHHANALFKRDRKARPSAA